MRTVSSYPHFVRSGEFAAYANSNAIWEAASSLAILAAALSGLLRMSLLDAILWTLPLLPPAAAAIAAASLAAFAAFCSFDLKNLGIDEASDGDLANDLDAVGWDGRGGGKAGRDAVGKGACILG